VVCRVCGSVCLCVREGEGGGERLIVANREEHEDGEERQAWGAAVGWGWVGRGAMLMGKTGRWRGE
jgi:hypothetical protein